MLVWILGSFIPIVPVAGALTAWYFITRDTKNPLEYTSELLRYPAQSLKIRIWRVTWETVLYTSLIIFTPLAVWLAHFIRVTYFAPVAVPFTTRLLIDLIIAAAVLGPLLFKIVMLIFEHKRLTSSAEAHSAAAQELDQLLSKGARVFHDFPGAGFYINHIVVASNGVFAIKTEAEPKPNDGTAKVLFDGNVMKFPSKVTAQPILTARQQARWLADYLFELSGERVIVHPAVALPGWEIEAKSGMEVFLFNPKRAYRLPELYNDNVLSNAQINKTAELIAQISRDSNKDDVTSALFS